MVSWVLYFDINGLLVFQRKSFRKIANLISFHISLPLSWKNLSMKDWYKIRPYNIVWYHFFLYTMKYSKLIGLFQLFNLPETQRSCYCTSVSAFSKDHWRVLIFFQSWVKEAISRRVDGIEFLKSLLNNSNINFQIQSFVNHKQFR